jgi:hypothetical protein
MRIALVSMIVIGMLPLIIALRAHRGTSLFHALIWMLFAWLTWGLAFGIGNLDSAERNPARYAAVCLTGCAGIAVLGARRPIVAPWNFVVLGLFAVMVLPLVETLFIGTDLVDPVRFIFMGGTIAVGILNYLPTRFGPAAFVLLVACAGEITHFYRGLGDVVMFDVLITVVPWFAWMLVWLKRTCDSEFDRVWLGFRDHWGLMWSQRVREQFNAAAQNAGWSVKLTWRGLRGDLEQDQNKYLETLRATLQRFLQADQG